MARGKDHMTYYRSFRTRIFPASRLLALLTTKLITTT